MSLKQQEGTVGEQHQALGACGSYSSTLGVCSAYEVKSASTACIIFFHEKHTLQRGGSPFNKNVYFTFRYVLSLWRKRQVISANVKKMVFNLL